MKQTWIKTLALGIATLGITTTDVLAQSNAEVIVSESVPVTQLDKNGLKDILVGKTAYWEGGQPITIVVLSDKTDQALEQLSGMTASQFKTHWQRLAFSGRGKQPKEVDTAEKLVAQVAATKGAVGLVPAGTALQGVKKVELK